MQRKLFLVILLFSFNYSFAQKNSGRAALNNYRDKIFSIFNKCRVLDDALSTAIKTKNVNDIEQKRTALLQCAIDGMNALETMESFEEDASLKYSCKEVLNFYRQTAEYDIPQIRDFFIFEVNFLKIKSEFEKKPVKKHSESEIIAYNKEVRKNNEGVTRFNQLNDFIVKNRKTILNNWNSGERIFMQAHRK